MLVLVLVASRPSLLPPLRQSKQECWPHALPAGILEAMPGPSIDYAMRVALHKWLQSQGSKYEREDADAYRKQTAGINESMAGSTNDRYIPAMRNTQHAAYLLQGRAPKSVVADPHPPSHFAEGATKVVNAGAKAALEGHNNAIARGLGRPTLEADDGLPIDEERVDPQLLKVLRRLREGK